MNALARSKRFGFAISTLALGLAACASESSQPAGAITGLHFTAATEIPASPPPDVDVTLTDPTPSRAIYTATLALPVYPPGTDNCPIAFGCPLIDRLPRRSERRDESRVEPHRLR